MNIVPLLIRIPCVVKQRGSHCWGHHAMWSNDPNRVLREPQQWKPMPFMDGPRVVAGISLEITCLTSKVSMQTYLFISMMVGTFTTSASFSIQLGFMVLNQLVRSQLLNNDFMYWSKQKVSLFSHMMSQNKIKTSAYMIFQI